MGEPIFTYLARHLISMQEIHISMREDTLLVSAGRQGRQGKTVTRLKMLTYYDSAILTSHLVNNPYTIHAVYANALSNDPVFNIWDI